MHSDWQSTWACLYGIGKSNIMLTWTYIIVIEIEGKQNFSIYPLWIYLPKREQTLINLTFRKEGICY